MPCGWIFLFSLYVATRAIDSGRDCSQPVIGILTHPCESHGNVRSPCSEGESGYVKTEYVKFLQNAGARVVPVFHWNYTVDDSVDGILVQGGVLTTSEWRNTVRRIYEHTKEHAWPALFGICLGFQYFSFFAAVDSIPWPTPRPTREILSIATSFMHQAVQFVDAAANGSSVADFPSAADREILSMPASTVHRHRYGVPIELASANPRFCSRVCTVGTAKLPDGQDIVVLTAERERPVWATQFHPETAAMGAYPGRIPARARRVALAETSAEFQAVNQRLVAPFVAAAMGICGGRDSPRPALPELSVSSYDPAAPPFRF